MELNEEQEKKLVALYSDNEAAEALFDWFDYRQNSARETKARIASEQTDYEYSDIIDVFREMDAMGLGSFIVGRHGSETRISWSYDIKSLASYAKGKSNKIEKVAKDAPIFEDEDDISKSTLSENHSYRLRHDLYIEFNLPGDFNDAEATRLAAYIKTLPIPSIETNK